MLYLLTEHCIFVRSKSGALVQLAGTPLDTIWRRQQFSHKLSATPLIVAEDALRTARAGSRDDIAALNLLCQWKPPRGTIFYNETFHSRAGAPLYRELRRAWARGNAKRNECRELDMLSSGSSSVFSSSSSSDSASSSSSGSSSSSSYLPSGSRSERRRERRLRAIGLIRSIFGHAPHIRLPDSSGNAAAPTQTLGTRGVKAKSKAGAREATLESSDAISVEIINRRSSAESTINEKEKKRMRKKKQQKNKEKKQMGSQEKGGGAGLARDPAFDDSILILGRRPHLKRTANIFEIFVRRADMLCQPVSVDGSNSGACRITSLLLRHCPLPQSMHREECAPCPSSSFSSNSTSSAASGNAASRADLLEGGAVPHCAVASFVISALGALIPKGLLDAQGSNHNLRVLQRAVVAFVALRRHENLSLGAIIEGMKTGSRTLPWTDASKQGPSEHTYHQHHPPSDAVARKVVLCRLLLFLFRSVVCPLIRA